MKLVVVAAGFTPGEADQLRRAMGAWRRTGVIEQFEQKLIDGMLANGYTEEFARNLFRQIEGFGSYGFPESHAASFALLVYVSAWIKCHHPAVFLAVSPEQPADGFLRAGATGGRRSRAWCRGPSGRRQSERLGLHARASRGRRQAGRAARLVDRQRILASAAETVVRERQAGPFTSYGDFVARTGLHDCGSVPTGGGRCVPLARSHAPAGLLDVAGRRRRLSHCSPIFPTKLRLPLPLLSPAEEVIHDYHAQGLSLRGHPFASLRASLERRRVVTGGRTARM